MHSPAVNKSLRAVLIKICTSRGDHCHCHCCRNAPPTPQCAHIHCSISINVQQVSMNVSGMSFFCMEELNTTPLLHPHFHVSDAFCQTAPLLPSVTRQQNVMGYRWEGSTSIATPPTSASDVVGQHHKIGGIPFGAALVHRKQ